MGGNRGGAWSITMHAPLGAVTHFVNLTHVRFAHVIAALRHKIAASLALGVLLSTGAAAAQTSTAEVERLIKRGGDLRRQGKDQEALPLFEKAYETAHTPRTAAQLGLCEIQLGYWLAADEHLSEALAGRSDAWMDKHRSVLQEWLRRAQEQIGEVVVTGTPASADVSINGRSVPGRLPLAPTRVVAGQVKVELRAPGYIDKSTTVNVPAKSQVRVALDLERMTSSAPPAVSANPEVGSASTSEPSGKSEGWPTRKILGASMIGAGVLAVAGGATLLVLDKRGSCDAPIPGSMCEERSRTNLPGWGLIGLGAALGAAGAVLVYSSSSSQVALSASPGSIVLSGRF